MDNSPETLTIPSEETTQETNWRRKKFFIFFFRGLGMGRAEGTAPHRSSGNCRAYIVGSMGFPIR